MAALAMSPTATTGTLNPTTSPRSHLAAASGLVYAPCTHFSRRCSMDPVALAAVATTALAPALPYLVKAGEGVASEAGKRALGAAWDRAVTIWGVLSAQVKPSTNLADAATELAANPQDEE